MKKIISLIIVLSMMLSLSLATVVHGAGLTPFTDVKSGAWYEMAVLTVNTFGFMEGKSEGKFEPNSPMTRAELVTVLYRLSGETVWGAEDNLTFKDVKKNAWYAEAVGWAVSRDLATGYPDNTFRPNTPVLRQELAKMFVVFLEYMEITKQGEALVERFADSAKFPSWAAEFIEQLRVSGLMGGDDSGNFKPKANASRAEIATVLTRLIPLMEKDEEEENGGTEFVPTPAPDDFELCEEETAPKPYYIRFPEGYSADNKYPLVIFTAGGTETSVADVGACFYSEESPVYDSIVMIPGVGTRDELEYCADLFDYVVTKYSVDTERVYLISTGRNDGNFFTWKMLEKKPTAVSAVLYVHGGSSALSHSGTGATDYRLEGLIIDRITKEAHEQLKSLPIYYHHCTDEKESGGYYLRADYGENLGIAYADAGLTKTVIIVDTGYPTIYDDFAVRDNFAAMEWLFSQRREIK